MVQYCFTSAWDFISIKRKRYIGLYSVLHVPSFQCMFDWNQPASAQLLHVSMLLLAQSECTSVETGQLFHQSFRPSVATAEVLARCKVQRGSVSRRLGDPSHVLLLMLSRGEVDTQPTGVTLPPPNQLSQYENGAETWICLVFFPPFHQRILCFCGLLIYLVAWFSFWHRWGGKKKQILRFFYHEFNELLHIRMWLSFLTVLHYLVWLCVVCWFHHRFPHWCPQADSSSLFYM